MNDEKQPISEQLRAPVSTRALGVIYLFISFLVIAVGTVAHWAQTTIFDISSHERIFQQLDIFYLEYVLVGFFFGVFLTLGLYYLRQSFHKTEEKV